MSSKLVSDRKPKVSAPTTANEQSDVEQIMKDFPRPKGALLIQKFEMKPNEQKKIPLGSFMKENPPKGFLVEIDPDPNPLNSVVTEVTSLDSGPRYTLFLQAANFSSKIAHAEIWRL